MPIVTTRKQRHNKRKETTKKPTRQSRRLVGRWTATSRVPRCEVANMNTRKTKGGSLTNFWTKYGNCDIAYENMHTETIKELEILPEGTHQPFKNSAVLCGSVLSYEEEEESNKKYLCIKRINDGRHRTGNSWITKRSYFLPYIHRKLIKKKDDKVRVIVGLGIQASKNTKDQITDFEKEFESTFQKAKDDSLAIITNMMGTQNVSYTFNGYSCNAVQNSANASELQKKEPQVLFTVDVRRSKTRDTKQNTEQGYKIEDIIKKIRDAIDVSVCAFNSAEFTIETRIKIIYSILFLKEYAYQIISTLLIFFELHELIKDTENVRDVHKLILEFYFGRLSAQATDEMLHIQEVCANKVLLHKKVDGITKPQKKTTAELIENLNDLKNKMVQIQLQGNEKINMFDEMFSKMRTTVLNHNLNIINAQKTTVSGLVRAKEAVLHSIKKPKGGAPSQIKDDEFSYYTYCMYMLKTFDICKEIIGTRDITAEEWGNPHELLQQIIQSIKKVNIVDTDVKDHEIYEIANFEKMKACSLEFDLHSMNDIVHICKYRRKYTDYIRQKLSLYQNVCFRKVSEELLRRYYNQQQVLNEKHRTIKDKDKDIGHKNEKFATFKDAMITRGSLGNTAPALKNKTDEALITESDHDTHA